MRLVARENYLEANSKLSMTRSLSQVGGPALAGVLIQWLAAPAAIIVDALSFVFSAIQIARLKMDPPTIEDSGESVLQRARSGMAYLLRHPYLRASLGCATTVNFFGFIGGALVVLFASRELGLSPGVIGLALGIGASGGVIGAALATRLSRWIGVGPLVAAASVVLPLANAILAFADGPFLMRAVIFGGAEFVFAFAVMCFDIPLGALQASVTDQAMRSRVSGAFLSINFGVRPIGAVLGGLLGSWLGLRETLLIAGIGGALSVLWLIGSPILKTRSIEELVPPTLD